MRNHIERGPAVHDTRVYRRVRHIEGFVIRSAVAVPARHPFEEGDRFGRILHCIDAARRVSRMSGRAFDRATVALLALVGDDRLHQRRLPDDA